MSSHTVPIPETLTTREEVEAWCIAKLDPSGLLNPAFEMEEDGWTVNIWGPTEPDFHVPLIGIIHTFTNHLEIRS